LLSDIDGSTDELHLWRDRKRELELHIVEMEKKIQQLEEEDKPKMRKIQQQQQKIVELEKKIQQLEEEDKPKMQKIQLQQQKIVELEKKLQTQQQSVSSGKFTFSCENS